MPQQNKTFCIAPWVQVVLRTSKKLGPCCQYQSPYTLDDLTINDYYNSDWNKKTKEKMLLGEEVAGCTECYQQEAQGKPSMRQDLNRDYKIVKPEYAENILKYFKFDQLTYPTRLELHISNICNLKCLTCDPADSSAFLTETVKLKHIPISNKDFQLSETHLDKLYDDIRENNIDILDLRGGESMMVPKIKNILLEDNIGKNIKELRIQTNATIFDEDWKTIFTKFPKVEIHLSIDAFDKDNHYIRYPSHWKDIEKTLDQIKKIPNVNVCLNTVVSNLNVLILPKLFDWCLEKEVSIHLTTLVYPEKYMYTNLPDKVLTNGITNLSMYIDKFKEKHTQDQLRGLVVNAKSELTNWVDFCSEVSMRDNHRKNSIFDVLPELKEYWTDAKTN